MRRQVGLFLGSQCLEAEQECCCSSALQDATGVRHLPLALAAVGLQAGTFLSGGERRAQCQELAAVCWCSLTPSRAMPGLLEELSVCFRSGAISIKVTFVPWSHFPHAQMVQSLHCPCVS